MENAVSKPSPKTVTASLGMERSTLATTVTARRHTFGCDEAPPRYDSTDAHPDPYDYILAGLAACTLITIRLSAEAKGIPLEGADVRVVFERCLPQSDGGQADRITRTITLRGDLSEADRTRLIRAADCEAYRSISNGIPITTESAT